MEQISSTSSTPRQRENIGKPTEMWNGLVTSRRDWAKKVFTRHRLFEALKDMIWVVPLTILIWFYAEREQLVTSNLQFNIEIRSADPANRIVTLKPPADRGITAEVTGPLARIDEIKKELERKGVQMEIDGALAPGQTHDQPLAEQLDRLPIFKNHGIGIRSCQPANIEIFVDKIEQREAPIRIPTGLSALESANFDPPSVKVTGPATVLDRLERDGQLYLTADIAELPEMKIPGQHDRVAVNLIRPFRADHVTVASAIVRASLKVRQSDVEYKIPSMPVFLVTPQGLQDKYKVVYNPILTNVTVVGPPDRIELLQKENALPKPKAMLEITREDGMKAGQPQSRRVRYDLPDGIRVKEDDAKREVEFKLVERTAPE